MLAVWLVSAKDTARVWEVEDAEPLAWKVRELGIAKQRVKAM